MARAEPTDPLGGSKRKLCVRRTTQSPKALTCPPSSASEQLLAERALHARAKLGRVSAMVRPPAHVAQHGACLHAGELVLVPQQDHPSLGGYRLQQPPHQSDVHHARLVHDDQIRGQRVVRIVPETGARPGGAQRAVDGGGLGLNAARASAEMSRFDSPERTDSASLWAALPVGANRWVESPSELTQAEPAA